MRSAVIKSLSLMCSPRFSEKGKQFWKEFSPPPLNFTNTNLLQNQLNDLIQYLYFNKTLKNELDLNYRQFIV